MRGPLLGWWQPGVSSREARGPWRTLPEAILNPVKTCGQRTLLGKRTAFHLVSWRLRDTGNAAQLLGGIHPKRSKKGHGKVNLLHIGLAIIGVCAGLIWRIGFSLELP